MPQESTTDANRDAVTGGTRVIAHLTQAASVAGNRGQIFLYNPAGSRVSYRAHILTLRGGSNAAGQWIPQFFFGSQVLADVTPADAVSYLLSSAAATPALQIFGRDTLAANILTGDKRQLWRSTGTLFGDNGALTGLEIPPGSWFAWAPPVNSAELNVEATMIETRV